MNQVDPVRLEVIRNALIAGAEEMNVSIWRTARSTVVRETLDYSTALFDGAGRAVAQSTRIPVHLNSMSVCLEDIIAGAIPIDEWRDGDVILTNDPYAGGQHLSDFVAFKPIFIDGRRVAIAAADVNADGEFDLITVDDTDETVTILLGNGSGAFEDVHTFSVGQGPSAIAVADFNGDGVGDIAVTNEDDDNTTVLLSSP